MRKYQNKKAVDRRRLRRYQLRELRSKQKSRRNKLEALRSSTEINTRKQNAHPVKPISVNQPTPAIKSNSEWWAHIRGGFVRDPSGKHHKALHQAVWLYLYFLVAANWRTGTLFRKTETIVSETGFSPRSVARWLGTLRKYGYITTTSSGRSLTISITKWRPISYRSRPASKADDG